MEQQAKRGAGVQQISPLENAIEYIEKHLNENISLSDVAKETGYSYYHMTRLFSSIIGESAGHYINRRRLYNASEKLVYSNQRIIDIALECGFESSEAFSRAFKSVFGSSPADYRRAGLNLVIKAKTGLTPEDVSHIANNITHTPDILILQETKVAGLRGTTSLSDNRIPKLWEQYQLLHKKLSVTADAGYIICETQQTAYAKDGDVTFSVMAGSPINNHDTLPPPLSEKTLSAGRYAVFTHRGPLTNLFKTYQYIYGTWLPTSKEKLDNRDDFEVYNREILSYNAPDNEVRIHIPIK
ncbi:AraC family transcriptional regulator [Diplocloster hominis]|uniref:AraC family transcriptional regulator n=1 Tax=Diplocloster hominis TaxID=3079010 RepID=UPI0031B9E7E6